MTVYNQFGNNWSFRHPQQVQNAAAQNNNAGEWNPLDPNSVHPLDQAACSDNADPVEQAGENRNTTTQVSNEAIYIRNSCDVTVTTTDTQAAVALQAALEAAIALVVSIAILDTAQADRVTQDLLQQSRITQRNNQLTVIEGSKGVTVTTTDTDVAVTIQILLQILIALVVRLEIL